MSLESDMLKIVQGAIQRAEKTTPYDTPAKVVRVEDDTVWVHIDGGVDETPVRKTINAQAGDKVQVRVSGGSAWVVGNDSAPPTDDTTAIEARIKSLEAEYLANNAWASADEAKRIADHNAVVMATEVLRIDGDISDLQNQIDGNITTWFYAYVPTTSNAPANTWTTTEEKTNHLGDLFYNTTTGYAYRWMSDGATTPTFSWSRLTDTDVTKALADAAAAQDTADHKRRVFVSQPTVPYDIGDLWCVGASGDILTCTTAKNSSQSYSAGDWTKLNKYTDDTAANAAAEAAASAQSSANEAALAASAAQSAAESAQGSATTANTAANAALTQLGIVEDVVDVLNWISEHGSYKASTDTTVVAGKYYFSRTGTAPNYTYTVIASPSGNPSANGYYELDSVDSAISNYVSSHLALTNQGLWVISDNNSYKILLASDGMKVYDSSGNLVSTFGESITFSSSRAQYIGGENAYIVFNPTTGAINIGGSGVILGGSKSLSDFMAEVSQTQYNLDMATVNIDAGMYGTITYQYVHDSITEVVYQNEDGTYYYFDSNDNEVTVDVGDLEQDEDHNLIQIRADDGLTARITSAESEIDKTNGDLDRLNTIVGTNQIEAENNSLIARRYAKIDEGALVFYGDDSQGDTVSQLEITAEEVTLKAEGASVASMRNDDGKGVMSATNMEQTFVKMVTQDGSAIYQWIAQSNGHMSLKRIQ